MDTVQACFAAKRKAAVVFGWNLRRSYKVLSASADDSRAPGTWSAESDLLTS